MATGRTFSEEVFAESIGIDKGFYLWIGKVWWDGIENVLKGRKNYIRKDNARKLGEQTL